MGQTGKVFVTDSAPGFVCSMGQRPEPEVDGLFGGSEIREDLVAHVLHTLPVWRATTKSPALGSKHWEKKSRGEHCSGPMNILFSPLLRLLERR